MGSHFIEDPVGGVVDRGLMPIKWGPMMFRLKFDLIHKGSIYECFLKQGNQAVLISCGDSQTSNTAKMLRLPLYTTQIWHCASE